MNPQTATKTVLLLRTRPVGSRAPPPSQVESVTPQPRPVPSEQQTDLSPGNSGHELLRLPVSFQNYDPLNPVTSSNAYPLQCHFALKITSTLYPAFYNLLKIQFYLNCKTYLHFRNICEKEYFTKAIS